MLEKDFPEFPDSYYLKKGPHGDDQDKETIALQRKMLDGFCRQAAYPCQQHPAKNYQRNSDFVTVKLG